MLQEPLGQVEVDGRALEEAQLSHIAIQVKLEQRPTGHRPMAHPVVFIYL